MESIYVNFDELPHMASDQNSSDPVPECQIVALKHVSLSPGRKFQENVSHGDKTETTLNELDFLFSPMFNEFLNGPSQVVSKSSAVTTADESIQCQQQQTTSLVNHTTPEQSCQVQSHESTVTSNENINQAELNAKNDQVADDEFINVFSTPVQDRGETSNRHVDSSNMHTFYQRYPSEHRWTKDHPLEQVIGNPSQSIRTRRQLELDAEMCMFALTVSRTEPKNIKEAMADSAWIESMQKELHQFDRLDRILLSETNLVWWLKDMRKRKELILKNLSHPLLAIAISCNPVQHSRTKHIDVCYHFIKEKVEKGIVELFFVGTEYQLADLFTKALPVERFQYLVRRLAIAISCNPVQHSRTKHIDVHYHFIKEKVENGIFELFFVGTEYQLADLFTKALPVERFQYLVRRLGMRCLTPAELEALANESA
nr:Gag-Pol polyprotein [Tanacetum cinerariifolium]